MSETGRGGADVDGVPGCSRVHQGPSAPSPRPEQDVGRSQRTPGGVPSRYTGHSYRDRFYGVHNAFTTLSVTVSPLLSLSLTPEEGDS